MKSTLKAGMVVVVVFFVGFLSGIGAVSLFQGFRPDMPDAGARFFPRQADRSAREPAERIERLARELDLTPGQRERFIPVLQAGMEKIRALRQKHRPEVRQVLIETREALRALLDEDQCRRFDELSCMMGPDPDYRGFGRCLQDTERPRMRGMGHDRRGRQGIREGQPVQ